jgi:hypothetical protein
MNRLVFVFHIVLILLSTIAVATIALAQDPGAESHGFSGKFQVGGIALQTDNQLSTSGTDRKTDDLDGPGETGQFSSLLASIELRYRFKGGTTLYTGNPLEPGKAVNVVAGVNQPLGSTGALDVAVTWQPLEEVWKNPYQTGVDREKTGVDVYGLSFQWQQIGGSPWELSYQIDRYDVWDDEIGELESDLKRDGYNHAMGLTYALPVAPGTIFKPKLKYAYADLEGRSNRYHGIEASGLLQWARPPWILVGVIAGAYNHFAEPHPLLDKTRKDRTLTLFAQVMRLNLFNNPRLFASLGAGYVRTYSNIDFFDSQTLVGLGSAGINF